MYIFGLTMSALILAYGAVGAIAQERMTPQPDQQPTSRERKAPARWGKE